MMGMYVIPCPACGRKHYWFSGNPDQRCTMCKQNNGDVAQKVHGDEHARSQDRSAAASNQRNANEVVEQVPDKGVVAGSSPAVSSFNPPQEAPHK